MPRPALCAEATAFFLPVPDRMAAQVTLCLEDDGLSAGWKAPERTRELFRRWPMVGGTQEQGVDEKVSPLFGVSLWPREGRGDRCHCLYLCPSGRRNGRGKGNGGAYQDLVRGETTRQI